MVAAAALLRYRQRAGVLCSPAGLAVGDAPRLPRTWRARLAAAPLLLEALALSALVYSLSGIQPWYMSIPAAGLALGAAGLGGMLLRFASQARPSRWLAVAGLICLLGLVLDLARYSPLFRAYPEWQQASTRAERYLERLGGDTDLAQNRPGVDSLTCSLTVRCSW